MPPKTGTPPPAGQGYNYALPAPDYNQTLLHYGDFVKQLGAQRHIPVADLNPPMAAATEAGRRTDPKFALSGDGVHPNEVGHLLMAAAVLKAWNAPSTVADIALRPGKSRHRHRARSPGPCPMPPDRPSPSRRCRAVWTCSRRTGTTASTATRSASYALLVRWTADRHRDGGPVGGWALT